MLEQLLHTISDSLHDHAVKILTGLVIMAAGWWIGYRRAKAGWKRREFFHRLNISLNYIEDGVLMLRTLSEKSCKDIFLNSAAAETIEKTARRTTATDPLLPLPRGDYWYYLNAVLNELSEQFATGALRKEQGQPVRTERYIICLTCECAGEIRMRKVRAMVIRKSLLLSIPASSAVSADSAENATITTPRFSASNHATRWETLKFMAAEYPRNPWRFIEVDLCA